MRKTESQFIRFLLHPHGASAIAFGLEHLSPRHSLFARFDARWKLVAVTVSAGMVAGLREPLPIAAACGVMLALAVASRVPARWFRNRILAVAITLLPFFLLMPLSYEGGLRWRPTSEVLIAAGALAGRALAIVGLMLVLFGSTPFHDVLQAARRLGAPGALVMLGLLAYRYIFLLIDELARLRIALRVRGFRNRTSGHAFRTIGQAAGTLIVRGSERADRVAQAMACRGFDGRFRSLTEFRTRPSDVALFVILVGTYATLLIWDVATRS